MSSPYSKIATQPEVLLAIREKGLKSRFEVRNSQEVLVAKLDWSGLFHQGAAIGSWSGGEIRFKRKKWWSSDLLYQLSGSNSWGLLPFEWRQLSHTIEWEHERFQLKSKGWFMRRFQLFDASDQLLADYRIRERFISFKIEISTENRLFKYQKPEALLLIGLYLLLTRLRNARRAS